MKNQFNLSLTADAYLSPDGVEVSLDIGNYCDDDQVVTESWSKIIDAEFGMEAIPYSNDNRTVFPYYGDGESGADRIYEIILALETVANKMRSRLESSYIYNHQKRLADGVEATLENKDQYIEPFTYEILDQSSRFKGGGDS